MKRVCLIGNCHAAALKLGWDRMRSEFPHLDLTFFASPAKSCRRIEFRGRELVPIAAKVKQDFKWTSGGFETVELDRYDCFILAGMGFGPVRVVMLAESHSYLDARLDPDKAVVSRDCFEQALMDSLANSMAIRTAVGLRAAVDRPIFILPQPGLGASVTKGERFRQAYARETPESWALLGKHWTECASKLVAEKGLEVIFQPGDTISNHVFTAPRFLQGAVRLQEGLAKKQPKRNQGHMNEEYGFLALKAVLLQLGRLQAAA